LILSAAATSNPSFTQLTQTAGTNLIMPCLVERQTTTSAVTNSLTNPTAGATTYFDFASANPSLQSHLTPALHTSPRLANDAFSATSINNNASLFSPHKDLHRAAAGT